jgi:dynactin complex subunit
MSTLCTDTWPCVGQRVCTEDGRLGFVRYRGTVERASGEWIGVEWDDPQWGKHSGQVDGRSYFTCR